MCPVICWAHPRVSGENLTIKDWKATGEGSSPRERGKQVEYSFAPCAVGLIPA